jgi:hypothetical protein
MTIKELLAQETYDPQWEPLWEYAKFVFDRAAKEERAILCGLDSVFCSLEDFCKLHDIKPSSLCAFVFAARGCFLAQAKIPRYHSAEWKELFPAPLRMTYEALPDALVKYKMFLEERKGVCDWEALLFLEEFEESIN